MKKELSFFYTKMKGENYHEMPASIPVGKAATCVLAPRQGAYGILGKASFPCSIPFRKSCLLLKRFFPKWAYPVTSVEFTPLMLYTIRSCIRCKIVISLP